MKTMYAVTYGTHEDYTVLGIFADEQTAHAWVDAVNADDSGQDANVESFPFFESGAVPFKVTLYRQSVDFWDNGTIARLHSSSFTRWPTCEKHHQPIVRYIRAPFNANRGGRLEVKGPTAEAVAKVVEEKIAAWKAGTWAGPSCQEIMEPFPGVEEQP